MTTELDRMGSGPCFTLEVADPAVDCGLVAPGHRLDPVATADWQVEAVRSGRAVWTDDLRVEDDVVLIGRGRRIRRRRTHAPDLLAFTWITSRGEALLLPRIDLLVVFTDAAAHLFGVATAPIAACVPVVASPERRAFLRAARDRPFRIPPRTARPVAPRIPRSILEEDDEEE